MERFAVYRVLGHSHCVSCFRGLYFCIAVNGKNAFCGDGVLSYHFTLIYFLHIFSTLVSLKVHQLQFAIFLFF